MPNPVIPADIEARWRPLTETEHDLAQTFIDDAWSVVLARVPGIEARMTADTLSTDLVIKVVSAMVLRVMKNPDGLRQWSIDDASFTRDQALSAGLLYLADSELAELMPNVAYMSGGYVVGLGG